MKKKAKFAYCEKKNIEIEDFPLIFRGKAVFLHQKITFSTI